MYTLDLTIFTRQNFGFTKLCLRKLKILPFYLSILRFALTLEERYHLLFHTYTTVYSHFIAISVQGYFM